MKKRLAWIVAGVIVVAGAGGGTAFMVKRSSDRASACDAVMAVESESAERREAAIDPATPLIAFLGDSYAQGQKLDDPLRAFPYVAAEQVGDSAFVDGRGGSGFVYDGPCSDQRFSDRVQRVLSRHPDVVVVQGGINDLGRDGQPEAVASLLAHIAVDLPDAKLVVVGPADAPGVSRDEVDETAEIIEAAAAAANASFVDLRDLDIEYLPDRIHATESGHETIGEAVAAAIR